MTTQTDLILAWLALTRQGPAGKQGPRGIAGAQGPAGPAGSTSYMTVPNIAALNAIPVGDRVHGLTVYVQDSDPELAGVGLMYVLAADLVTWNYLPQFADEAGTFKGVWGGDIDFFLTSNTGNAFIQPAGALQLGGTDVTIAPAGTTDVQSVTKLGVPGARVLDVGTFPIRNVLGVSGDAGGIMQVGGWSAEGATNVALPNLAGQYLSQPATPVARYTPDTLTTIAGFAVTSSNRWFYLLNESGTKTLQLSHDVGGADVRNIYCPGAANLVLPVYGGAVLWYDDGLTRWRVISHD